ncbi:hypothetical protein HEP84_51685 [Streptomyces sp. RLB1-33]|nr:hypothetical protein [Streptomyces sp. RLB1-33]QIY76132.1 hypothetical protein HEP84_51685 [Streptomyces sp. RLB1-33]
MGSAQEQAGLIANHHVATRRAGTGRLVVMWLVGRTAVVFAVERAESAD